MNWVFITQRTAFFIVTAVKPANFTFRTMFCVEQPAQVARLQCTSRRVAIAFFNVVSCALVPQLSGVAPVCCLHAVHNNWDSTPCDILHVLYCYRQYMKLSLCTIKRHAMKMYVAAEEYSTVLDLGIRRT
jgi:hypothetical protein